MTISHDELGNRIEEVVQEHLAESRRRAEAAVKRAFASTEGKPRSASRRRGPAKGSDRRSSEDVVALGERFYEAVCAHPGETMEVLSTEVGASSRQLHRSVTKLKAAGRIRSAGQRRQMRYFPMS